MDSISHCISPITLEAKSILTVTTSQKFLHTHLLCIIENLKVYGGWEAQTVTDLHTGFYKSVMMTLQVWRICLVKASPALITFGFLWTFFLAYILVLWGEMHWWQIVRLQGLTILPKSVTRFLAVSTTTSYRQDTGTDPEFFLGKNAEYWLY